MRVNYVTAAPDTMPAVRYRMILPGNYIGDYDISMIPVEADVHVFCKPYTEDPYVLNAYKDMAKRLTYVLDICDDVFQREGPVPDYMLHMAKGAAAVTASTEQIREKLLTFGIEAYVISDPYEFPETEPKSIDSPRVMWFGNKTSFDTLLNVECDYPVEIVCKDSKMIQHNRRLLKFPTTLTEWSIENMKRAFKRNNVVIIPSKKDTKDHTYSAKSPNRVVESIRNGMSVVAAPLPSYKQFDKWITLNWDMKLDLKPMTEEGQKYVRDNFDISIIGEQWKTLFDSILGVEQKSLRAG